MPNSGNSGEFHLLLDTLQDMRTESRDFRDTFNTKMDINGRQNTEILVKLAEHNGRLNMLQMAVDNIKTMSQESKDKLERIDSNTPPSLPAIRDSADGRGGWISVDRIPGILTAVGSLIAAIMAAIALMRSPSSHVSQAPTEQHESGK